MTRAARRVYGSGSASRGRRGAGAPGVLRLLRGYAFAIAGIAIGVAGVVALGAMSERIVRFIEGGDRFVLGQISVAGRGMGMGAGFTAGGLLPAATIQKNSSVPRVAGGQAQGMLPRSEERRGGEESRSRGAPCHLKKKKKNTSVSVV